MKMLFIVLMICTGTGVACQSSVSVVESLVNAERAFARTSKEKSTKEAFTSFLSDSGLIFQQGPVLGKQYWQQAPEGKDMLTWEPVFATISAAGDLGYSTGPWEYRVQRTDTAAAGNGYFVSVWKKENNEWKVALDIGISYPLASQKETARFDNSGSVKLANKMAGKEDLLKKETAFISEHAKKGWAAYSGYQAESARFYRPGSFPFITDESRQQLFAEKDKKFSYEPVDAAVSRSGDLGYVYGKAIIEITKDGNTRTINGNYLRIWKKEKNDDWKIVLDLVNTDR